jgi:hypothetical protein
MAYFTSKPQSQYNLGVSPYAGNDEELARIAAQRLLSSGVDLQALRQYFGDQTASRSETSPDYNLGLSKLKSAEDLSFTPTNNQSVAGSNILQPVETLSSVSRKFNPKEYPEPPTYTPYPESDVGRQLIEELTKRKVEAQGRQQQDLASAREKLKEYQAKQKSIDLLPLAALVDTWTGSNVARYFKEDKDQSRELALELQKEILKYGQQDVNTELEALKDRLGMGIDTDKIKSALDQNVYEANLRAKIAMDSNELDNQTKERVAQAARDAQTARDKYIAEQAYKRALLRGQKSGASEARQQKQFDLSVTDKVSNNDLYKAAPDRLKLLDIVNRYDKALEGLDPKRMASLPTFDPELQRKKTQLEGIYKEFTSQQKEVDRLGALTNSDIGIIWGQMPDATSALYAGSTLLSGGGLPGIKQRIKDIKNKLRTDHQIAMDQLRNTYNEFPQAMEIIDRQDKTVKSKLDSASVEVNSRPSETSMKTGPVNKIYQGGYEYIYDTKSKKYVPTGKRK